ncbi:MAG: DUF5069 domain-containing protein [Candidatus Cybelea sp.]
MIDEFHRDPPLKESLSTWKPQRSGYDELAGCIWLGRLLEKARRAEDCGDAALGSYLFGDRDYLDARLLSFLGLTELDIRRIVRSEPDDERAGQLVLQSAGKMARDVAAFNRHFVRRYGILLVILDADEGRRNSSLGTKVMQVTYNALIFPIARIMYNRTRHKDVK